MMGHNGNNQGNGGKRRQPDGGSDLVANTNTGYKNQRRNGNGKQAFGGGKFNIGAMMNEPCPKHRLPNKLATHAWKDCFIMREYRNSNFNQNHGNNNGLPGGSASASQGSGFGGSGSNSDSQGQGHQGGYNQKSGQGNQQQGNQSGYQSNPKQLNDGQYHVFTTSLCKRDQKIHKRVVNSVETAVPHYLRWSEQPIVWSHEDHPPRVDNPGQLALVVAH